MHAARGFAPASVPRRARFNSNVGEIQPGDVVLVAWRHDGKRCTSYLRATVAEPLAPRRARLAIDALAGEAARELVAAGYPASEDGMVEGIRLAEVDECCFELQGSYGRQREDVENALSSNNAIHHLAAIDAAAAQHGGPVLPEAHRDVARRGGRAARTRAEPARARSAAPVIAGPSACGGLDGFSVRGAVEPTVRAFDAYAMVDCSSRSKPCHRNDSIWIASGAWDGAVFAADVPRNQSTRREPAAALRRQLERWRGEQRRVLVGLDFAFGYPAGFADRLGLQRSRPAWRTVHAHFAARLSGARAALAREGPRDLVRDRERGRAHAAELGLLTEETGYKRNRRFRFAPHPELFEEPEDVDEKAPPKRARPLERTRG